MKKKMRQRFSAEFKSKIALLAVQGEMPVAQICSKYKIDAAQVTRWKQELLDGAKNVFVNKKDSELEKKNEEINQLYKQIGKLTVQNEFLQEKLFP